MPGWGRRLVRSGFRFGAVAVVTLAIGSRLPTPEDGSCAWRVIRSLRRDRDLEREKGIRWMPWHQEAMKDVARCDKPRGAASRR